MARRWLAGSLVAGVLVASACGGGGDDRAGGVDGTDPAATDVVVEPADPAPTDPAPTDPAPTVPPTTDRPDEVDDWTVLAYVIGDNDLEPFVIHDVIEMTAAGSSDRVNLVAYADRHPAYDFESDPLDDFVDAHLLYLEPGSAVEAGAIDPGERNFGDPDTLAEFIEVGLTTYPAEHTALFLLDHGAGWPGMGPDETDGNDILDLAEIDDALERGLAAAGVERLDIAGFDACLMGSYEVAATLADHARLMLASSELEPGHGWNYEALSILRTAPETTPEQLGAAIIDGFADQAAQEGTDENVTLALIDLAGIDELESALDELAAPLFADPVRAAPVLGRAESVSLGFGSNPDPALDSFHVDLGHLAANLGELDPALTGPAAAVADALDRMVLRMARGRATGEASGLSIYFPPNVAFFRQGYLFLDEVPVWSDLLTSFYLTGEAIPDVGRAAFLNPDGLAEYFFDDDGLNIFGSFDPALEASLVEAEIFYGVLDEGDGSIIYIGEEPGEVSTDGSGVAAAIYDLTVLTISDGVDTDYAYLDLDIDDENGLLLIDVPLWYVPPEEFETDDPYHDVILSLVLDVEGTVLSEVYYEIDPDGTIGELYADPDGLVYPIVLNEYPDGTTEWLTLSEQGLWADLPDLQYELVPLEPGTGLYAELVITDYGGNVDSVGMFDLVPG